MLHERKDCHYYIAARIALGVAGRRRGQSELTAEASRNSRNDGGPDAVREYPNVRER